MEGSGTPSSDERGAEKLMDDYLRSIGLHRKKIAKDGSCLFRAVAEQVLHCQSLHTKVRSRCVDFLRENRDTYEAFIEGDFEDYLDKLQDPQQWVGEVEINALAVMYRRDFLIFQAPGRPAVNITDKNFKDKVQLCFLNGNHYDSVYPISRIKSTALCQSVLYELLYDDVFKVDRSFLGACQRVGRASDFLSDDSLPACGSSDESDLDVDEPLWVENGTTTARHTRGRGRGRHLPERVRRSLNPTLFRNIQYDVWHKSKRAQQKLDYRIAAGLQFTVGDRCQVRLDGRSYSAVVKEAPPDSSSVTVYIEELGRKQIPVWHLRPPSDENSWSTVVNRDKRLSNGHGDWDGRGRGRGKHVAASSSASQAAAVGGPGVRVVKQHSWPPQAGAEEPSGAKATRKSTSTEASFGLTEKQRLAREEEQRNMALVEIQLRDEHSFPALGVDCQDDGGRKKGGEKRRAQRNKTKSPVEDVRAASPSAAERPKSSTPPPSDTAAAPPPANAPPPTLPVPPPAKPSAAAAGRSSLAQAKALTPKTNMAAAPTCKTNAPSCTSAAGAPPTSPPPAATTAPSARPPSIPPSAALLSFLTPVLPALSPPSTTAASPPPSSSLPPPTFIAPIAPSPTAALGFLPRSSSLSGCSQPRSPSPPSTSTSSTSVVHRAAQVHEATPTSSASSLLDSGVAAAQTLHSPTPPSELHPQSDASVTLTPTPALSALGEPRTSVPQLQMEAQSPLPQPPCPHPQHQSHPEVRPPVLHAPLPQVQSEAVHVSSSHPPPLGASYPHPPQTASLPSSSAADAAHPRPPVQPLQPPHPSQLPHLPLSLSASPTASAQGRLEAQCAWPPPDSPPAQRPHVQSAPPPLPVPGGVPLQQLSQLYQDPLYPGFPQGERGDLAPTPAMSSSKSGDDLPQDVNIMRFFFNLGVKAYSMPMFPPYVYLLPLQQAHSIQPKLPSRSPSPSPAPHYPPPNPPTGHQEAYAHPPQYPPVPASLPPQYEHRAPPAEPRPPSEPSYGQAGYPVAAVPQPPPPPPPPPPPQRIPCPSLPWQQQQMPPPRNPGLPVGYAAPSPPYPVHQGYHAGQVSGHPMYGPPVSPYAPSSLGYQSAPAHEDLQANQGPMEQRQPTDGDMVAGQTPGRVPAAANVANANNNRPAVPGFALKKEQGDGLNRAVLLVDPPLNNNPILVPNPIVKDVSVSMATSSSPGSPSPYDIITKSAITGIGSGDINPSRGYRGHQKVHPSGTYVPTGPQESGQVVYVPTATIADHLSIGCNTVDDWVEQTGFKPPSLSQRGPRRGRGGARGRGRGASDGGRGDYRRRHGAEPGTGYSFTQYNSSYRGRGRERGY